MNVFATVSTEPLIQTASTNYFVAAGLIIFILFFIFHPLLLELLDSAKKFLVIFISVTLLCLIAPITAIAFNVDDINKLNAENEQSVQKNIIANYGLTPIDDNIVSNVNVFGSVFGFNEILVDEEVRVTDSKGVLSTVNAKMSDDLKEITILEVKEKEKTS